MIVSIGRAVRLFLENWIREVKLGYPKIEGGHPTRLSGQSDIKSVLGRVHKNIQ